MLLKMILPTILSFSAMATNLPQSKDEFCGRFKTDIKIKDFSEVSTNLISFKNDGGLFNGGVCWWHSRFQRNLFYTTFFRPDLKRPNKEEIKNIIKNIRNATSVTMIPGYQNVADFTAENKALIQSELNSWQLYDGVVLGGWIDGIKGDTTTTSENLRLMTNELNDYVAVKGKIAYQKLQIKGITSHAWLVVNTKVNEQNGLDIGYIDSNDPIRTNLYTYKNGDQSFYIKGYGNFVPYLEFKREEERISNTAKAFCNKSIAPEFNESDYWEDVYEFENNI